MKSAKKNNKQHALQRAALVAFFNICKAWHLKEEEKRVLIGSPPRRTFFAWKKQKQGALSHDTLERISYILGIYKALQILFPNVESADGWIKKGNKAPLFNGKSALDRMLSGNVADLYIVRQYLDAQRGGWA
jgi:hypothetical protein